MRARPCPTCEGTGDLPADRKRDGMIDPDDGLHVNCYTCDGSGVAPVA